MASEKAIILAAGLSTRLRPLTVDKPKCLLPVGGKPILDWQLESLISIGIRDVLIVVGYCRDMIVKHVENYFPELSVEYITNPRYQDTNTLFSLHEALAVHRGDFYYLNADVVFDARMLERLCPGNDGGYLAVDMRPCREEEVKVSLDGTRIARIGKDLPLNICQGEFIGVAKFAGSFVNKFRRSVVKHAVAGNELKFFEYALQTMEDKSDLIAVDITGLPCIEIDFPEDYDYANTHVAKNLKVAPIYE